MSMTRSGSPIVQPSLRSQTLAGGASAALPIGAPPLAQAISAALCSSVSVRSFTNVPAWRGAACHGGIRPASTWRAIERAQGRVSW